LRDTRKRAITTWSISFLKCSPDLVPSDLMNDKLKAADPNDVAGSIAFALRFNRKKRFHEGDKLMAGCQPRSCTVSRGDP
jgi:hypothetical protein